MPLVRGSKGMVSIEMLGVAETARYIRSLGKDITDGLDAEVFRNATWIGEKVQDSIAGNEPEPKSVRTGRFGNSISVDKVGHAEYKVFPKKETYPNTNVTTEDVAKWMEHGTSGGIEGRHHFENTRQRTKKTVEKNIRNFVKNKIRTKKMIGREIMRIGKALGKML